MTNTQLPGDLYIPGKLDSEAVVAMLLIIGSRGLVERYVVIIYDDGRLHTVGWISASSIKNYCTRVIPELVGESHG
jgi:hypothetical protein